MTQPDASRDADAPAGRAWTALIVLGVVYMINFMDRQLFAVLQEDIRADLSLNDTQLALLGGTMFAVFYATLGLPLAWLADRTNRVRLIAACCVVWSAFTALSGMAAGFWQMALARIGVASGEAGGVAPSYAVISDYFPAGRRGLAIGLFSIGAPLGIAAGSALGALIAAALGWRWAFILLAMPGLVAALALVVLVREPKRGRLDAIVEPVSVPRPFDAARAILASPTLILLTLAAAATSFAGYGMYQWLPSFLMRSQGLVMAEIGQFLAPLFLLGVFWRHRRRLAGRPVRAHASRRLRPDPRGHRADHGAVLSGRLDGGQRIRIAGSPRPADQPGLRLARTGTGGGADIVAARTPRHDGGDHRLFQQSDRDRPGPAGHWRPV